MVKISVIGLSMVLIVALGVPAAHAFFGGNSGYCGPAVPQGFCPPSGCAPAGMMPMASPYPQPMPMPRKVTKCKPQPAPYCGPVACPPPCAPACVPMCKPSVAWY